MRVFTSYFYQVRFFLPHMIPISTALWDPKWFHNNKGHEYYFKDKNGVYNGFRAEFLKSGPSCAGACKGAKNCNDSPPNCAYLLQYREQLNSLDFDDVYARLTTIAEAIKRAEGFEEEPMVVLLVYETPDILCSERGALHSWFKERGHPIEELEYPIRL